MMQQGTCIAAALILLSGTAGHVEGAEKDRWGSDQVYLGRHQHQHQHKHQHQHQQGGDDEHGQPAGLTDNIDLGAKARAAHRSGKCELLVLNAPVVCFVKRASFWLLIESSFVSQPGLVWWEQCNC